MKKQKQLPFDESSNEPESFFGGAKIENEQLVLRTFFEKAADGIVIINETGEIVAWNQALEHITGIRNSAAIKRYFWEIHSTIVLHREGETSEQAIQDIRQIYKQFFKDRNADWLRTERVYKVRNCVTGKTRDLLTTAIKLETETELLLAEVIRDITEQRKMEAELRAEKARYEAIVNDQTEMICRFLPDGTLTFGNRAYARFCNKSEEELIGVNWLSFLPPQEKHFVFQQLQKITPENPINEYDHRVILDGVLRWQHWLDRGFFDQNGVLLGYQSAGMDITERKAQEIKLAFLGSISERVSDAIITTDTKYKFSYVNRAAEELLGYAKEELIGLPSNTIFADEQGNEIGRYIIAQTDSEAVVEAEIPYRRKNGTVFIGRVRVTKIFDNEGNLLAYAGLVINIDDFIHRERELATAKEKAEESARIKTNFLASMSHELRTPLNGIMGFAQVLHADLREESHLSMIELILRSCDRLLNTFNHLLALAIVEKKKLKPAIRKVNLSELLERKANERNNDALKKNVQFNFEPFASPLQVCGDEELIEKILNHLLENAIKFTHRGKIVVRSGKDLRHGSQFVYVTVSDTGIGISKENLARIFEDFRQVSEGYNREYEGIGLGLSLARNYARVMHGDLLVESTLGTGSVFTLLLPAESPEETEAVKPIAQKAATSGRRSILVVEDDFVTRELLSRLLQSYYSVDCAASSRDTLAHIRNKRYDAVLMDISLGEEIDGLEITSIIRKLEGYEETPIIALTANILPEDQDRALAYGCSHFIGKPFSTDELLSLLKYVISHNDESE